ncbi:hypothetical protein IEO21_08008 [Rhodonia placenta]|uniref:Uncharacterized protein n=1 Tax=Rhodonia placenta TaxID=104341 RepID=A0A8H7TZ83_9APHY|nr:hypothetical protein IEO21_08008 [Postia placenta]
MASQTTICPSALPIIARRGAPAAVKVSAKTLGQRLGWKKISRGHEATLTNKVNLAASMGRYQLSCDLLSLEAAQKRRGRTISGPLEVGEHGWRACGAYTVGCTLIPLDVAREDKALTHPMPFKTDRRAAEGTWGRRSIPRVSRPRGVSGLSSGDEPTRPGQGREGGLPVVTSTSDINIDGAHVREEPKLPGRIGYQITHLDATLQFDDYIGLEVGTARHVGRWSSTPDTAQAVQDPGDSDEDKRTATIQNHMIP